MPTTSGTNLKLDPEVMRRVDQLAVARSRSSDSIVREAIGEYLTRAEKREQFKRDAIAAWEDYQATGLHVTDEEFDEWVVKLEAGEDALPPKCHV
jgi:predicted transcriptional regulator